MYLNGRVFVCILDMSVATKKYIFIYLDKYGIRLISLCYVYLMFPSIYSENRGL